MTTAPAAGRAAKKAFITAVCWFLLTCRTKEGVGRLAVVAIPWKLLVGEQLVNTSSLWKLVPSRKHGGHDDDDANEQWWER